MDFYTKTEIDNLLSEILEANTKAFQIQERKIAELNEAIKNLKNRLLEINDAS